MCIFLSSLRSRVEVKMDAGGLTVENTQLMKNQKYSFEIHIDSIFDEFSH